MNELASLSMRSLFRLWSRLADRYDRIPNNNSLERLDVYVEAVCVEREMFRRHDKAAA